jgi:hypothetical protein
MPAASSLPAPAPRALATASLGRGARFDAVPPELKARRQWVVWRYERRKDGGKPTKVPYQVSGARASATNPATWCNFLEAVFAYRLGGFDGIGYVFSADDPYTGIDFDDCIDASGINLEVAGRLRRAASYAEYSPSGHGVKLIIRAQLAGAGARTQALGLEIYDRERFFTITGRIVEGCPSQIGEAQAVADEVYRLCRGGASAPTAAPAIAEAPTSMLRRGGPILRSDGTLRRPKLDHWLNAYLLGDDRPFRDLAARCGWATDDSAIRYHALDALYHHGYPDEELLLIARALLPQSQPGRDTARWWRGELTRCLYGPKGAATRNPGVVRRASRGYTAPVASPEPAPKRPGRPRVLDADYLLTWYAEEGGKRLLEGPRRADADALGVSVPTIERLDAELVRQGAIKIETLPKRTGRRVILLGTAVWCAELPGGAIKTPPAESPDEVPSELLTEGAVEGTVTPENGASAPQCIGEITGLPGTAPASDAPPPSQPVRSPCPELPAPPTEAPELPESPVAPLALLQLLPESERWATANVSAAERRRYLALRRGDIPRFDPLDEPLKFERHLLAAAPSAPPTERPEQTPLRLIPPELADLAAVLELRADPEPPRPDLTGWRDYLARCAGCGDLLGARVLLDRYGLRDHAASVPALWGLVESLGPVYVATAAD